MASRSDRYPALAASAVLHAAVLVAALVSWPWSQTIHMGDVVPVTLISGAQAPAPAPAEQAPQPQAAATEAPEPQAPPQPAVREAQPTPAPVAPAPKSNPQKVAPQPTPAKAKPTPTPTPSEDWTALAATLAHQSQASSAHASSAQRGPSRPNQAVQARAATGVSNAASAAAMTSLAGELQRLWNPNCDAPGGDVTIKVTFRLTASGRLDGAPASSEAGAADPAVKAASDRAVRAVFEGEPFSELPAALYGQNITVNFNQKSYCSSR